MSYNPKLLVSSPTGPGGYPSQMVSELICTRCHCLLNEPVETSCGHFYCRGHLPAFFTKCVAVGCEKDIVHYHPSFSAQRKVDALKVRCIHCPKDEKNLSLRECSWTGTRASLECHLKECGMETVLCDQIGCTVRVRRCDLANHLADREHHWRVKEALWQKEFSQLSLDILHLRSCLTTLKQENDLLKRQSSKNYHNLAVTVDDV